MNHHLMWGGFCLTEPTKTYIHDYDLVQMTYEQMHEVKFLLAEMSMIPGLQVEYEAEHRRYIICTLTPLIDSLNFNRLEYPE